MDKVIGIDAGIKTYCVIATKEGKILSKLTGLNCNWGMVDEERTLNNIKELLNKCNTKVEVLCIGISGVELEEDKKKLKEFIYSLNIANEVIVEDNLTIALVGATLKNYGIVVNASLSSIAFGINKNGKKAQCGGFQHVLGDEGSTYITSKRALIKAIHAYDKRGPKTTLLYEIPKYFALPSIPAVAIWVYSREFDKYKFANLFNVIVKEALKGDRVSINVLKETTDDLLSLCKGCIKKLNMKNEEFDIATVGDVFLHSYNLILPRFKKEIKEFASRVNIIKPYFTPSIGAVILALQRCNVEINNKIINNINVTK